MRKIVRIGFIAVLLLGITACSSNSKESSKGIGLNEFLIGNSVELTRDMDRLAEDEELLQLFASTDDLKQMATEMKEQDYTSPVEAYIFRYDLKDMLKFFIGDVSLSEDQTEILERKMFGTSLITMLNGKEGATFQATTSILNANESYRMPDVWKSNALVYLVYDGKYSSLVSFQKSGDGIVSSTSYFVKQSGDITETMDSYGFEKVHISGDELKNILN